MSLDESQSLQLSRQSLLNVDVDENKQNRRKVKAARCGSMTIRVDWGGDRHDGAKYMLNECAIEVWSVCLYNSHHCLHQLFIHSIQLYSREPKLKVTALHRIHSISSPRNSFNEKPTLPCGMQKPYSLGDAAPTNLGSPRFSVGRRPVAR